MSYETLIYDVTNDVALITLNRPDAQNGLNAQMRFDLLHAIKAAEASARVIMLIGQGDVFCAGQDLTGNGRVAAMDMERILREEYQPLYKAMHDCKIPIVAAVNGNASGAGATLALNADIIVAARSADFSFTASRLGMTAEFSATYALPRQVGFARAMGAVLLGENISADQAHDWGMIWKAVSDKDFDRTIGEITKKLADGPTVAFANTRKAMRAGLETGFEDQLDREAGLLGETSRSRDFVEGVLAYSEQRVARFEGR